MDVRREEVLQALLARTKGACSAPVDSPSTLPVEHSYSAALGSLSTRSLTDNNDPLYAASLQATQHADVVSQLQQTLASISEVGAIAKLQQSLSEYDTLVSQGAFIPAASIILQLQVDAGSVPGAEATLQDAIHHRLQIFKDYVISVPQQYLFIDPSTHIPALLPPAQDTAAGLEQVWGAAAALGVLQESMTMLSSFLVESCVKPILRDEIVAAASAYHHNAAAAVMESPANSIASSALSAATTVRGGGGGGSTSGSTTPAAAGAERALYRCLKSICDGALGRKQQQDLVPQFGELFWPAAAATYISAKLKPRKPMEDSELAGFMRLGSLAIKLEQKAVKLRLWRGTSENEGPIAKYVRQTIGKVLASKRVKYATAARDLLTSTSATTEIITVPGLASEYFHRGSSSTPRSSSSGSSGSSILPGTSRALFGGDSSTFSSSSSSLQQTGGGGIGGGGGGGANGVAAAAAAAAELSGEPPIGDVGPYAISRSAEGLVSLMHDALSEACRSGSAALAQAMCGAVVDLSSLFLALGQLVSEQERVLPYIAALRYNDCMHVYRTLCTLPHAHSPRLQSLVHPSVNFIAPALRVRATGEEAAAAMVARQQQELLEIAVDLQRWRGLDGPGVIRCKKASRQLLAAFHRLGDILRDVLPNKKFVEVASVLANAVCRGIAHEILSMGDISAEESEEIPKILVDLTQRESGLLAHAAGYTPTTSDTPSTTSDGAPSSSLVVSEKRGGVLLRELVAAAQEVEKLREICEMLEVPSREIAQRWRSGRLAGVGLSKEQVVGMVRALFEDNEYSRASLNTIMQTP